MRKILCGMICYILLTELTPAFSQSWQQLFPEPTSKVLGATFFLTDNLGWIVGDQGTILKTIDGGSAWEFQSSPVNQFFSSCYFIDQNLGFIAGTVGTILKTTDGGSSWSSKPSSSINLISVIQFTDSIHGFALAYDSMLKTVDGGESWQRLNIGNTQPLLNLYFLNDTAGWISCANGKIMKTNDGGATWTEITSGFPSLFLSWIKFFDSNIGFAGGDDGNFQNYPGRILKTIDGGFTWSLIYSSDDPFVFTGFLNDSIAYFVNDNNVVFATHDQFNSVNAVYNPQDSTGSYIQIYSAQFPTDSTGYMVGTDGFIAKTTDQLSSWQKINKSIGFVSNSMSAPDLMHIWATDGYFNNIVVRSSSDGGITWSYIVPDSADSWYFVSFTDSMHGWISGFELLTHKPKVGKTNDGGLSWNIVSIDSGENIWSMTIVDENHGWLGTVHKVYRTTDGGYTWSSVTVDSAVYIRNIDFINAQEGWLVTSNYPSGFKRVEHTTDSGQTWQIIFVDSLDFGTYFTEVDFVNSNVGFLTGAYANLQVLKTIDGGYTWTEMNFDPDIDSLLLTAYLGDLKVTSANNAWFCGNNYSFQGFIIGTNDGGITWQLQLLQEGLDDIRSMCFASDTTGWTSAGNGYFFKLNAATAIESFSDQPKENLLQIFPNPAVDRVHVNFIVYKPSEITITIFDVTGKKLLADDLGFHTIGSFEKVLPIGNLPSGIYELVACMGEMNTHKKLLKF